MMRSWVTRRHEQAASGVKLDQFSEQHIGLQQTVLFRRQCGRLQGISI
jgi:hypothetical protein